MVRLSCSPGICRWMRHGLLAAAIILIDQCTKRWIIMQAPASEYALNKGFCWGMFSNQCSLLSTLSYCMLSGGILLLIALVLWHVAARMHQNVRVWPYVLIAAGAISNNLIDRPLYQGVIDFIVISFSVPVLGTYTWPLFNVADIAIVVGVCAGLYYDVIGACSEA